MDFPTKDCFSSKIPKFVKKLCCAGKYRLLFWGHFPHFWGNTPDISPLELVELCQNHPL